MSLTPGGKLGPYEILSPLGEGGMDEQELTLEVILNWPALLKGKASSQ